MSTQHKLKRNTKEIIKLDKVDGYLDCIAEYKRCAILKYCNEYGIEKYQLDMSSISNEHHKLGMCYCFLTRIICIILEVHEDFYMM